MEIINIQKKLAKRAKSTSFFDNLFRYISSKQFLNQAYANVCRSSGSNTAGIDGITKQDIKDIDSFVSRLSKELCEKRYVPNAVRRVYIDKANGKKRSLGIPTFRDKVVQESARLVLEPIYESKFYDRSFGFRPKRQTMDAIHLCSYYSRDKYKYFFVVEGDIENCFDHIEHKLLVNRIRETIVCKKTLRLIKQWLHSGVFVDGKIRLLTKGVSQGGIISPLLSNIFLDIVDKYFESKYYNLTASQQAINRRQKLGNVAYIRYADDFVILTNGGIDRAKALRAEFESVFSSINLKLSPTETKITHVNDGYDFLGFNIKRAFNIKSGKHFPMVRVSVKSMKKVKSSIKLIFSRSNSGKHPYYVMKAAKKVYVDWYNYFKYGHTNRQFNSLTHLCYMQFYGFLKKKHSNVSSQGSIGKYVMNKYYDDERKQLGIEGQYWDVPTKVFRYKIDIPKDNVYLLGYKDYGRNIMSDQSLYSDWLGGTLKAKYIDTFFKLIDRDGKMCSLCGSTNKIQLHHKVREANKGKHGIDDCVLVCKDCHVSLHAKKSTKRFVKAH